MIQAEKNKRGFYGPFYKWGELISSVYMLHKGKNAGRRLQQTKCMQLLTIVFFSSFLNLLFLYSTVVAIVFNPQKRVKSLFCDNKQQWLRA